MDITAPLSLSFLRVSSLTYAYTHSARVPDRAVAAKLKRSLVRMKGYGVIYEEEYDEECGV